MLLYSLVKKTAAHKPRYERLPPDIGQDWWGTTSLQGAANEAGKECETGLLTSGVAMKLRNLKLSQRF
jgi:hypothetical protein